ncbi:MAG: AraC family transcriptional regulator [Lachnospiraceae bacterium]|nr:AraC family transcriptional regulator [Lachnospiraceae bacterium]
MHYDSVLAYVRKILKNNHIPTAIYEEPFELIELLDNGLRESLLANFDKDECISIFLENCKENTLYYFTDEYYCSYACMQLPNAQKKQYFVIGPFTYIDINQKNYYKILEELELPSHLLPLMETYYYNITFIRSEADFKNMIGTLAETIWQDTNYTVSVINGSPLNMPYSRDFITESAKAPYLMPTNLKVVEERYEFENQIMQAVSQGNLAMISQILPKDEGIRYIPRLADSLRDYKNYMVVFNTLLRKAAEHSAVHPAYLDRISTKFAQKIEALTTVTDHNLEREMLHRYCLLVRNHSVKGYSPVIQKVINQINLNLASDLGLKTLSEMFNISAGYLSTLFKKETGMTLTDYVNKKRVEHAIFLLNTTHLQIQVVASYCGIQDINYFTRIFKKFCGMTPKKYRDLISKPLS